MTKERPKELKIIAGGKKVSTETPLEVRNPYDGSLVATTFMAGGAELDASLEAASSAFEVLKKWPAYKRAAAIERVVEGLKEREEEFARIIALEAGKPIKDARGEARRAQETFRIALEESRRLGGEVLPLDTQPGSEGRFAIVRRFPVGPVLAITPFNFPLNLVAHKAAPAMACGNPVIIKPSPKAPLSALVLGEIICSSGWPVGGVSVLPASVEDTERLLDDERIKNISFTGSAAVGWAIKARAGTRKVTLELGGNAGVIVHEDTDLEYAATRCATGAFSYAGQICISVQRIYVQRQVFDRFRDLFLHACSKLKCGDPLDEATDVGPMIEQEAALRTERWVEEAVGDGAKLLLGGKRTGAFFTPTVLTGTKPSMKVCGEEVFAPVAALEPYGTFEEAVGLVNGSLYGLQAGVFTRDTARAFYAYENIEVGGVIMNDIPTYRVDHMPYGGVKMSGFGREGVRYAIEEMTEPRLLAMKP